jgi:cytochrome c biogenesis protein CcmG/thiol:disulfide interchange protein DsbE
MLKYLLPLGFFLALSALLAAGIGKDPTKLPSPLIDKPAPAFALSTLAEPVREVTQETFKGEPYLLNVWASWCVSCRQEHPVLEAFARTDQVRIVGLNWKDTRPDAQRWLGQFGNPFDEIIVDEPGRVGVDFGVYGTPETFLVDAEGVIRFKHVGPLTRQVIDEEIVPRLKQMKGARS